MGPGGGPGTATLAVEAALEVRVNGAPFAVIMRTPGDDRALVAGFLLAEDVVRQTEEIVRLDPCADTDEEARDYVMQAVVQGDAQARLFDRLASRRQVLMTSGCGLCGRRTLESLQSRVAAVHGAWAMTAEQVSALPVRLRETQTVFTATGGLHAAGLFDREGHLLDSAEDVGRHNAVDKIVGRRLLAGDLPLADCALMVSGRASFELVQKALLAGIPLLAAVSAPSSLAVEFADAVGMTLCGFVRGDACTVYTHPQRVVPRA
jgi:FdhD protein